MFKKITEEQIMEIAKANFENVMVGDREWSEASESERHVWARGVEITMGMLNDFLKPKA